MGAGGLKTRQSEAIKALEFRLRPFVSPYTQTTRLMILIFVIAGLKHLPLKQLDSFIGK